MCVENSDHTTSTPPLRSLIELDRMVDQDEITEAELGQYFQEREGASHNLEPVFTLDENLVQVPQEALELESALLLNAANSWCKRLRRNKYLKRVRRASKPGASPVTKVVTEGDSWYQYPFKLHDVIDHLIDREDLAVLCYSEAGDILTNMVARREFLSGIRNERPEFFLISGGGNDLVDGPGLRRFLLPYQNGRNPGDYFRTEYQGFKAMIAAQYRSLFSSVLATAPSIKILCHGYSYPVPNNGKWLGKPMKSIGIKDPSLRKAIMDLIVDDINSAISRTASSFGSSVKYLDVRGVVPANGWYDEFHPTSSWFGEVAKVFSNEI